MLGRGVRYERDGHGNGDESKSKVSKLVSRNASSAAKTSSLVAGVQGTGSIRALSFEAARVFLGLLARRFMSSSWPLS